jgi:hypothetical protein
MARTSIAKGRIPLESGHESMRRTGAGPAGWSINIQREISCDEYVAGAANMDSISAYRCESDEVDVELPERLTEAIQVDEVFLSSLRSQLGIHIDRKTIIDCYSLQGLGP